MGQFWDWIYTSTSAGRGGLRSSLMATPLREDIRSGRLAPGALLAALAHAGRGSRHRAEHRRGRVRRAGRGGLADGPPGSGTRVARAAPAADPDAAAGPACPARAQPDAGFPGRRPRFRGPRGWPRRGAP